MTAHVAGLPLEELMPLAGFAGGGLLAARAWLGVRLRRRRVAGGHGMPAREKNV